MNGTVYRFSTHSNWCLQGITAHDQYIYAIVTMQNCMKRERDNLSSTTSHTLSHSLILIVELCLRHLHNTLFYINFWFQRWGVHYPFGYVSLEEFTLIESVRFVFIAMFLLQCCDTKHLSTQLETLMKSQKQHEKKALTPQAGIKIVYTETMSLTSNIRLSKRVFLALWSQMHHTGIRSVQTNFVLDSPLLASAIMVSLISF